MGVEASEGNKLYIRLPVKIEDEFVVKDLHPNIVKVHLPRQKSRRWCIIEIESKEAAKETIAALKKVRINNKSIKISEYKTKPQKDTVKTEVVGSTKPLLKLLIKIMGITFRGNPLDQYVDDDDLENDEEWFTPELQGIAGARVVVADTGGVILYQDPGAEDNWDDVNVPSYSFGFEGEEEDEEDDTLEDEDYQDDDDDEEDIEDNNDSIDIGEINMLLTFSSDEDIDYVTYPANDEPTSANDDEANTSN